MNTRVLIHSLLGCGCAGLIVLALVRNHHIQQLKLQESELQAKTAAAEKAAAGPRSAPSVSASEAPLNNEELKELMRLRNEVHKLRQREQELSQLRTENENLQKKIAANAAGAAVELPPGYVRRHDAKFVGFATPEATLQSLFWAAENRDTNVIFRAVEGTERQFNEHPEQFWNGVGSIPGFLIVRSDSKSDSEVELKVEFAPGRVETMFAHKVGADWRLHSP